MSDPIAIVSPASLRHTGSGVPQYRSREIAQSTLFSSHLPMRPCLMCSGYQSTDSFVASRRSRSDEVAMYHDGLA